VLFQSDTTTEGHFAQISATVENSPDVSGSASDVTCSFAGGCSFSVAIEGLSSSAAGDLAVVTACGESAEFDADASDATQATFKLPPVSTIYSIENYNIQLSHTLEGEAFSSFAAGTYIAFDGDNSVPFGDTTSNPCYVGLAMKSGYVGIVSQVKFFMNEFDRDTFVDSLSFQGSNDGASFSTLFTVSEEIHEGWNYYDYDEASLLKYRYYRLYGITAGAC